MRNLLTALCCLALWPALALGEVSLKLPKTVTGDVDDFIEVQAETDGATVKWYSPDKGLKLFPVNRLKDTKTAIVFAKAPGKYRLVAFSGDRDGPTDPVVCCVEVGDVPPPTPPVPPAPPTDPFTKALWDAYAADGKNVAARAKLVDLYKALAERTSQDEAITTVGALRATQEMAQVDLVGKDLPAVRKAITAELNTKLPRTKSLKLNATHRAKFKEQFGRVAAALGVLR